MNCEQIFNTSKYLSELETDVVYLTTEDQKYLLHFKELECRCRMKTEPAVLEGLYCNRTWDDVMCWDDTAAGVTVQQPCASYINSFQKYNYATRTCLEDGTWYKLNDNTTNGWTNFNACLTSTVTEVDSNDVSFILSKHVRDLRLMYNIGYALSLISLFVAFFIMVYFKKLHCSRNTIHLNLFASFMFRASISLIRDNFMVEGLGFPNDVTINETGGIVEFKDGIHWECRMFFSVFQYVIVASYTWIFVEAVYLHMYIFVSVFTEKLKVWWFCLLGWFYPVIFVLCWCLARYHFDNTLCWNTYTMPGLIWIIQGPIMLTVIINIVFFINIVRVLYTKLQAPHCPSSKRTRLRRLARSTFFLVPVFGVYFIFFSLPLHNLSDTMEFVMLFIEMFVNSFQGFFIALVLCFISHEVRTEIKRSWTVWRASSYNSMSMNRDRKGNMRSYISRSKENSRVDMEDKFIKLEEITPDESRTDGQNGTKNMNGQSDGLLCQEIG